MTHSPKINQSSLGGGGGGGVRSLLHSHLFVKMACLGLIRHVVRVLQLVLVKPLLHPTVRVCSVLQISLKNMNVAW